MARIRKIVQSMTEDTRPPPPPNSEYLFRHLGHALAWAGIGLILCLLTWVLMFGLFLWVSR